MPGKSSRKMATSGMNIPSCAIGGGVTKSKGNERHNASVLHDGPRWRDDAGSRFGSPCRQTSDRAVDKSASCRPRRIRVLRTGGRRVLKGCGPLLPAGRAGPVFSAASKGGNHAGSGSSKKGTPGRALRPAAPALRKGRQAPSSIRPPREHCSREAPGAPAAPPAPAQ